MQELSGRDGREGHGHVPRGPDVWRPLFPGLHVDPPRGPRKPFVPRLPARAGWGRPGDTDHPGFLPHTCVRLRQRLVTCERPCRCPSPHPASRNRNRGPDRTRTGPGLSGIGRVRLQTGATPPGPRMAPSHTGKDTCPRTRVTLRHALQGHLWFHVWRVAVCQGLSGPAASPAGVTNCPGTEA